MSPNEAVCPLQNHPLAPISLYCDLLPDGEQIDERIADSRVYGDGAPSACPCHQLAPPATVDQDGWRAAVWAEVRFGLMSGP